MSDREVWKRRLGPLWGGAVALATSSALRLPGVTEDSSADREAPSASWMVGCGLALGLAGFAVATLGRAAGIPLAACTTMGLLAMVLFGGAVAERAVSALAASAADSAVATTAVAGSLLVRAQLLASLPPAQWLWAFPAVCLLGRWTAAFLQGVGDPILDAPSRSLVATPPPAWELGALTAALGLAAWLSLGSTMLLAMGLAAALAFGLGLVAQRRRGGLGAEVVGLAALCGETLGLLVLAAA